MNIIMSIENFVKLALCFLGLKEFGILGHETNYKVVPLEPLSTGPRRLGETVGPSPPGTEILLIIVLIMRDHLTHQKSCSEVVAHGREMPAFVG